MLMILMILFTLGVALLIRNGNRVEGLTNGNWVSNIHPTRLKEVQYITPRLERYVGKGGVNLYIAIENKHWMLRLIPKTYWGLVGILVMLCIPLVQLVICIILLTDASDLTEIEYELGMKPKKIKREFKGVFGV